MRALSFPRRGLTLIELLLVIALLLAAAGLVFPAMIRRMDDRAFESAGEVVLNQLLLARAQARLDGEPVEVVYRPDPPRVEARLFAPGLAVLDLDDEPVETSIAEDWAIRPLSRGLWIDARPPDDDAAGEATVVATAPGRFEVAGLGPDEERGGRAVRLAVFLPDGSALLGDPVWLGDGQGRHGRVSVNPWTGLPSFEPDARASDLEVEEGPDDPEDDEPESLEDFAADEPQPPARADGDEEPETP